MRFYTIRTLDGDDLLVNTNEIVRIYKMKNKVTFSDGSVVRVGTAELDRLIGAVEGMETYQP